MKFTLLLYNSLFANGLVIELAPPYVQNIWGSRGVLISYFVHPQFACQTPKIQEYYFLSIGPREHPE